MFSFTPEEQMIIDIIDRLKQRSGSHSPSIHSLNEQLPQLRLRIDACFLSNPYATRLFWRYFKEETIDTGKLIQWLEYYPSQGPVIAEVLAEQLRVPASHIFVGNGATEIIQAVLHGFAKRRVLIIVPTFSPYYEFVSPGVEISYHHLQKNQSFLLDSEAYLADVQRYQPQTVVLINPNNPNGGYLSLSAITKLLDQLTQVEQVIIDESFIHFAFENDAFDYVSVIPLIERYPNIVVIKSMSKDFGVAGLRAGYAVMAPERVSQLVRHGYLWNVSGLAEYFFRLYTRYSFISEYNDIRIRYIQETRDCFKQLAQIPGIHVYPSMANFVLIEIKKGISAHDVFAALLVRHGIYTRLCSDKLGISGQFLRVASRTLAENKAIVGAFRELFEKSA